MAYTRFGEFARVLRIKVHEVMGEMAAKLGVSAPFLSAVENGKKNVPPEWNEKISKLYQLSPEQRRELEESIEQSKMQCKISLQNASLKQREMAMAFARSFDHMDDETAEKVLALLNKTKRIDDSGL